MVVPLLYNLLRSFYHVCFVMPRFRFILSNIIGIVHIDDGSSETCGHSHHLSRDRGSNVHPETYSEKAPRGMGGGPVIERT